MASHTGSSDQGRSLGAGADALSLLRQRWLETELQAGHYEGCQLDHLQCALRAALDEATVARMYLSSLRWWAQRGAEAAVADPEVDTTTRHAATRLLEHLADGVFEMDDQL